MSTIFIDMFFLQAQQIAIKDCLGSRTEKDQKFMKDFIDQCLELRNRTLQVEPFLEAESSGSQQRTPLEEEIFQQGRILDLLEAIFTCWSNFEQ